MKSHFFHAFASLNFIFSVIFVGLGLYILPTHPEWSYKLSELLKNNPNAFSKVGQYLMAGGGALLLFFYLISRKSYYHLKVDPSLDVSIEEKIIHKGISELLQNIEPQRNIPFTLNIYGQNIEIIADLSKISFEKHEGLLDSLEPKLSELMSKAYGQPKNLTLSIAALKA